MKKCDTTATPATVNATSPIPSIEMLTRFERNSRHGVFRALENSSGGSTTRKTNAGFSDTCGIRGKKLSTSPPSTSTIGYGILSRCAKAASSATSVTSASRVASVL